MPWLGEVKSEVVVAIIELHESLQSAGDPQNTRKENPLRFSLFPYRNVCQAFRVDMACYPKRELTILRIPCKFCYTLEGNGAQTHSLTLRSTEKE